MPVFTKGSFSINLGFASIGGQLDETDRQCAWELYCELVSRVAVVGKVDEKGEQDFTGEVLAESLDSLYRFFGEARSLMRRYPVGRIGVASAATDHLGFFIAALLEVVIRPFLEKWQARYRHWWVHESDTQSPPFRRQAQFPQLEEMLTDWKEARRFCRASAKELTGQYKLPDVTALEPPGLKQTWIDETKQVFEASAHA